MKAFRKTFIWITLFSIAMGYLETAVVVYMRYLIYGDGWLYFPLRTTGASLAPTELGREAATIIMLVGIGILTGRNALQRFAYFLYSFAVWDIFYYIFLKVLVGWPDSLFTWDVLFLIPAPWMGPVIAPCLLAVSMMFLSLSIIWKQEKSIAVKVSRREWFMMVSGCLVVIFSFLWDYIDFVSFRQPMISGMDLSSTTFLRGIIKYTPYEFNWLLFGAGLALLWTGIISFLRANKTSVATQPRISATFKTEKYDVSEIA